MKAKERHLKFYFIAESKEKMEKFICIAYNVHCITAVILIDKKFKYYVIL